MFSQISTTRAMGLGMAVIPECRPGLPSHVWPDDDTLICNPTFDVASGHLLVAAAAQYYGRNGYRIRQPFDFAGRTGKIVFDASTDPLGPLFGWISLAITEDPISLPGYSIQSNDEGSIIPKNALEVHFANAGGDTLITARNVHVFHDFVDTVYTPPQTSFWVDFLTQNSSAPQFTLRARFNGKAWHDRVLAKEEAAFFSTGPTTLDPTGTPMGHPGTQGRLALMIDVPLNELVAGDNTVEFVTANVPTSYPPPVCNIDLVMQRN